MSEKIVFNFLDAEDKTITLSYSYPKSTSALTKDKLNAFMDAVITNGAIFKRVPVSKKSAYVVKTDQTDLTLE